MNDQQRTFVSARIADLEREAAALRAERVRDRSRVAAGGTQASSATAALVTRRVRLGRWLVAIGQRIDGTRPATGAVAAAGAVAIAADDPGDDGNRLAPAA